MPTRAVADLSGRYPTEWAICCHLNLGAQKVHIRRNQEAERHSFVRFTWQLGSYIRTQRDRDLDHIYTEEVCCSVLQRAAVWYNECVGVVILICLSVGLSSVCQVCVKCVSVSAILLL